MRAPLPLRLAWSEIRNDARFSLFFALNLALGLSGFVALDAFKTSLEGTLDQRSRTLLGADVQVVGRRPFTQVEQDVIRRALGRESTTTSRPFKRSLITA